MHNPPGEEDPLNLAEAPNAPDALKAVVLKLKNGEPVVNQWVCIVMLAVSLGLMAATAEWLVQSLKVVHQASHIEEEYASLLYLMNILTGRLYPLDGLASSCSRLFLLRRMGLSHLSTSFDICYGTFSKLQFPQRHLHVVRPSTSVFNSFFSGCPSSSFSRGGLANHLPSFLVNPATSKMSS